MYKYTIPEIFCCVAFLVITQDWWSTIYNFSVLPIKEWIQEQKHGESEKAQGLDSDRTGMVCLYDHYII